MENRLKILFITDSLGFPRNSPQTVMYEDSYICLLKDRFKDHDFIHQGKGGATIVELFDHTTYFHETLNPDIVFMQTGIVDCAPRALSRMELSILARLPVLRKPLTKLVMKNSKFLRKTRNISYTRQDVFQEYVAKFDKQFPNVYWIGILPASDDYELKVANIQDNILRYNEILEKSALKDKYINVKDYSEDDIMSDYHHLSKKGHNRLCKDIGNIIQNFSLYNR